MSPESRAELLAHVRRVVDEAPPLTDEMRSRLAVLLRPTGTTAEATTAAETATVASQRQAA